ncbi:MAG: serine/threonine-protein kinase, partial [Acidobacteriota bacterium]
IHDLEESEGTHFLVLEYVPGETLAERIDRGPLPFEEALPLFKQITEGLEAAHEKGVIHRDLKPANIKITPEGQVKILDFGLAKAMEGEVPASELSHSPTISHMATQAGVILGTASYMSPEQARGKPVDKRTDIWAFGCVLYEMLTGRKAFKGESITDIFAAVMKEEPDWTLLPVAAPVLLRVLSRLLRKDPVRRLRDVGDARIAICEAVEDQEEPDLPKRAPGIIRIAAGYSLVFILGLLLSYTIFLWRADDGDGADNVVLRFGGQLPVGLRLTPAFSPPLILSPDGKMVVFNSAPEEGDSRGGFWVMDLEKDFGPRLIENASGGVPFFSPDGKLLGFLDPDARSLYRLSLSTGAIAKICDVPGRLNSGATWGTDGTIALSSAGYGLMALRPGADQMTPLLTRDRGCSGGEGWWPQFIPEEEIVIFSTVDTGGHRLEVLDLKTGSRQRIEGIARGSCGRILPPDKLVYVDGGALFAARIDTTSWQILGEPVKMLSGIHVRHTSGLPYFSVSSSGSLVYSPLHSRESRRVVLVDRAGQVEPLTHEEGIYGDPSFSPNGSTVAVTHVGSAGVGGAGDIYLYGTRDERVMRLTTNGLAKWPRWTPDGSAIVYGELYRALVSRSVLVEAEEELLWEADLVFPASWNVNGRELLFEQFNPDTGLDIFSLELGKEPEPVLVREPTDGFARLSPNGKWLAYQSDESGQNEIYVRAFPGNQRGVPVSTRGGEHPIWSSDGRELFYIEKKKLMRVTVDDSAEPKLGTPTPLFEGVFLTPKELGVHSTCFDVSPDGERFVMLQGEQEEVRQYNIIVNWVQEVEERLAQAGY